MYLDEFFDYKNRLAEDLLTNPEIVKLLTDTDGSNIDPAALMYTQVFPYEYIPDTIEHASTFICCDVDIYRVDSKLLLEPRLYIWVFTHKSKMRLPEGGVRVDRLAHEIAKTIDGSRFYGLGELNMYSTQRFAPISDYQGKQLTFEATDFNRHTPTGKPVPTNRRQ